VGYTDEAGPTTKSSVVLAIGALTHSNELRRAIYNPPMPRIKAIKQKGRISGQTYTLHIAPAPPLSYLRELLRLTIIDG
jgi:hypothetical protein